MDITLEKILGQAYSDSELIIGIVGAVGIDIQKLIINDIVERLELFNYHTEVISVSRDIINVVKPIEHVDNQDEFERIRKYMDAGNQIRLESEDNSALALGITAYIFNKRRELIGENEPLQRYAFIIKSLKHPDEVSRLREIYSDGFYLIGINMSHNDKKRYLIDDKSINEEKADILIERDENEKIPHGQRTRDTFYLSDFFVNISKTREKTKKSIWRILDNIFGYPYLTPTFDEYAMFLAYSASLRSADLSRQVGAIIAYKKEILATGANDCPQFKGGLYWSDYYNSDNEITDKTDGRDYKRGYDSNKKTQEEIMKEIFSIFDIDNNNTQLYLEKKEKLQNSAISDLTEFGRAVHAEMEAILCCARNNISTRGATLYCTTFPCHNCAKHIIAAGIKRVVYIEPYPKSKAADFHSDAISIEPDSEENNNKVIFEPFIGLGPRRFFDLFSTNLGSGYPLKRKTNEGKIVDFDRRNAKMRIQMLPCSYIEKETLASKLFNDYRREKWA